MNLTSDPRHYQIAILAGLLAYGLMFLAFPISWQAVAVIAAAAMAVQMLACWWLKLPFDVRSPLITILSLCLLLRTDSLWLLGLAAAVAIGSKFIIRVGHRHLFNPANIGIVAALLTGHAWVSPGQWGSGVLAAFFFASLGLMVITRARSAFVSLAFLTSYVGLLIAYGLWLGDPIAIALHQTQSGALLLFAFFMISDPKTTPNTLIGQCVFAALVASLAFVLQSQFYYSDAVFYALPIISLLYGSYLLLAKQMVKPV